MRTLSVSHSGKVTASLFLSFHHTSLKTKVPFSSMCQFNWVKISLHVFYLVNAVSMYYCNNSAVLAILVNIAELKISSGTKFWDLHEPWCLWSVIVNTSNIVMGKIHIFETHNGENHYIELYFFKDLVFFICVCVCYMWAGTHRGQKRGSDSFELEIQDVISCPI